MSYNTIYIFSACQKWGTELYNNHYLPLKNNPNFVHFLDTIEYLFPTPIKTTIEFVKNGDIVYNCIKDSQFYNTNEYDFIVDTEFVNKVIYSTLPIEFKKEDEIIPSVKFIMVELIVDDESLNIKFSTNEYNYAVIDNKINKDFITYFIRKHYLNEIYNDIHNTNMYNLTNYILKIIDNKANVIFVKNDETLVFKENTYIIENNVDINEKNEQNGKNSTNENIKPFDLQEETTTIIKEEDYIDIPSNNNLIVSWMKGFFPSNSQKVIAKNV